MENVDGALVSEANEVVDVSLDSAFGAGERVGWSCRMR